MRGRDTRKTLKEIGRSCIANGIELSVIRAKGSHRGLIFEDRKRGRTIRIVIAGHGEISPGVQRNSLKYLGGLATRDAFAELVRKILEAVFRD